jgi:hypothetical protein
MVPFRDHTEKVYSEVWMCDDSERNFPKTNWRSKRRATTPIANDKQHRPIYPVFVLEEEILAAGWVKRADGYYSPSEV